MAELQAVFLYHLGGGFTEIRKVGYRYLQRQPDERFLHLLVWLFNDEHVCVTFGCHRRLMPQHVMDFLVEVGRILANPPVAATPVRIAEPPSGNQRWCGRSGDPFSSLSPSCPSGPAANPKGGGRAMLFPAARTRRRRMFGSVNAGIGNDYNTDGGQRSELAIGCATRKLFRLQ
ncbi:hypothetical protein PIB30_030634 [Stylosanthes scabra]|uniref:Uncharacterized protein n=1 Tax=Stylosanthes scabra TaxID=79078 RepID=A0ABU6YC85_9FABA|nr:hypothetical protein [Stylosanthes scabra]